MDTFSEKLLIATKIYVGRYVVDGGGYCWEKLSIVSISPFLCNPKKMNSDQKTLFFCIAYNYY